MAPSGDDLVAKSHSSEGPCVHLPQPFGSRSVLGTTELRFIFDCEIREEIYPIEAIRRVLDDHYGEAKGIEVLLFYYPGSARILDDGTIAMGVSGWESGQGY